MHGLPANEDLSFLRDKDRELICFAAYQVNLHFEEKLLITILGSFRHQVAGRSAAACELCFPLQASELIRLLTHKIQEIRTERVGTWSSAFSNGDQLIIEGDNGPYESYHIQHGQRGRSIVLTSWRWRAKVADVARKLRVEYPGAIYHVMNRGDRREAIFNDSADRQRFLDTLGEACLKTGWQVLAYCLMPNHFHLVLETPQANLVAGMKWLLGVYTSRFNRRHKLFGHLFSGRYKSLIVDGSGNGYLRTVCDYVHLNPARAKLLLPEQPLRQYAWSSWPEYLKGAVKRPAWLRVDRVLGELGELGILKDDAAGRRRFAEAMEERRGKDQPG